MKSRELPPGYAALVERLMALIEEWCGAEPGLPDLRWLDPGDTMFIGGLQGKAVDFLVDSPDARRLVAWLDDKTGHEATLFQVTVALRMLGHLPRQGEPAAAKRPVATTRHAVSECADCGARMDASTGSGDGGGPKSGDLAICLVCGAFHQYGEGMALRPLTQAEYGDQPRKLRPFVPQTQDAVPAVLREALDLAVTSKLRGVVILLAFHDRTPMQQLTAGDLSVADAVLLVEHWKHQMLHGQSPGDAK